MHKHRTITLERLQKFAARWQQSLYLQFCPVQLASYHAPGRISYQQALEGEYQAIAPGYRFAPLWSTHWVRVDADIPKPWQGQEVHFLWDSSCEACLWQEGVPQQGFTGHSQTHPGLRTEYIVSKQACYPQALTFYMEVACNGLFGEGLEPLSPYHSIGILRQAQLGLFSRERWDLLWDFTIIAEMAQELSEQKPRAGEALRIANEMVNILERSSENIAAARKLAQTFLQQKNGHSQHHISAIGHAHIDTAWLWPIVETKRKCYRTFATAVRYMQDYPDYRFVCSQAQQYQWIKQDQPQLYQKIQEWVKKGQFIPAGGTWVEPDCNMPSGESLVRQFLLGQRFFREEFGRYCQEFWNPDVFGYCAQLPQIMRQAGIKYFLTQKLSWNQFNQIPHHSFFWEALDGSRVLTHFPPTDTYTGIANTHQICYHVNNYRDHSNSNNSYLVFGHGDGGGGPTYEMLERVQRLADVDGLPHVVMRSPQEFFERLEQDADRLATWVGELYFEMHRGTYTTQAKNKLFNRRSEVALHDLEFLYAIWDRENYPQEKLTKMWQLVLLHQFHDIIPGSSIGEVYEESALDYERVLGWAKELQQQILSQINSQNAKELLTINTLGHPRQEVVTLPPELVHHGQQNSSRKEPLAVVSAPAFGYQSGCKQLSSRQTVAVFQENGLFHLQNQWLKASFSPDGHLVALYHFPAKRDCLPPEAKGNQLLLFPDYPNRWEAWDVDVFHLENPCPVADAESVKILERGPLRASLLIEWQLSANSRLQQEVRLSAVSPRLDFVCHALWNESQKFLKVEFPWLIRALHASYETQFGYVTRPTHFNTSWDLARFEVCAQRWADLSEPDFGVALLNDCKYGYSTHGNTMRLSLLRSPKNPDPEADQGEHHFCYALLPHQGTFQEAGVIQQALALNHPLLVTTSSQKEASFSSFQVQPDNVIMDTIKKAQDSKQLILRFYEAHGKRGYVCVKSTFSLKKVAYCNLLEHEEEQPDKALELSYQANEVQFAIRPFEIVSLKIDIG